MKDNLPGGIIHGRAAALAVALAVMAVLSVGTMLVHAGWAGRWGATTFQLYNSDASDAPVTITFYDEAGSVTLTFTDTLPAGGTRFYEPEELPYNLPVTFTGMLYVSATQDVFGVVYHFADPADPSDGNVIYRMIDTDDLTTSTYLPYVDWNQHGWFTNVHLQNPHGVTVTAVITYYNLDGTFVGPYTVPIDLHATESLTSPVPIGSARVQASRPILVVVSREYDDDDAADVSDDDDDDDNPHTIYNGQPPGSALLRAPYVHSDDSFIAVQNTGNISAEVQVVFHWPQTETITATVEPLATHIFTSTQDDLQGQAVITGTQPVAAVVVTQQSDDDGDDGDDGNDDDDDAGAWCYNALRPMRASQSIAIPSVLHDCEGWGTLLWIQNLTSTAQAVEILYTAAPTGTLAYTRTPSLAPHEVYTVSNDWLPPTFQHAAVLVVGSGEVGALVRPSKLITDGAMGYEGYAIAPLDIPAPVIQHVNPSASPPAASLELVIDGRHFQQGATMVLSRTGQAPISASVVSVTGATTITAQVDLTGAVLGEWDVVVTNADGRTATAPVPFTVQDWPYHFYLPLAMKG